MLVLAATIFLAGALIAFVQLPKGVRLVRWSYLVFLGLSMVPATVILNAARFDVTARLLGRSVGVLHALRVSVGASAANLLPLPGAMLIRIQGLKQIGESYRSAALSNGIVAGAWVAVSCSVAGALQLAAGHLASGSVLAAIAIAAFAAASVLMMARVEATRRLPLALGILGIEGLMVLVAAFRLQLVLLALGVPSDLSQTVVLTLASVAASAVGFLPGGMGLREAIASGLAPLVSLPASLGYLTAAIDRLVGLAVLVPVTLVLLGDFSSFSRRPKPGEPGPHEAEREQP